MCERDFRRFSHNKGYLRKRKVVGRIYLICIRDLLQNLSVSCRGYVVQLLTVCSLINVLLCEGWLLPIISGVLIFRQVGGRSAAARNVLLYVCIMVVD